MLISLRTYRLRWPVLRRSLVIQLVLVPVEKLSGRGLCYAVAKARGDKTEAVPNYQSELGYRILEDSHISTVHMGGLSWLAWSPSTTRAQGCSALAAGLRCYVIQKLGTNVEVPKEFL